MTAPKQDRLLTVEQVADLLPYERATLYSRRARKQRPHSFLLGGKVVYRESEVLAFIAEAEAAEADR